MSQLRRYRRRQLLGGLTFAVVLAFGIPFALWPMAETLLTRLGVVALSVVFVIVLAIPPIARYRRAIGKPMPFDHVLSLLNDDL